MKNLIPNFIQKKYQKDICDGNFDAFTMFIDISGFTQMTEALMEQGEEGAEILSQILNRVFNPIVNAIYANGGFISTFAGDAFTAIFPKENTNDAFHLFSCAQNIQSIFENDGLQQTKVGDFQLQVKIGLSYGNVDWGIVGHERKTYFFSGEGVDGCAHSEHQAEKGQTIFDDSILSEVEKTNITFDDKKNGYFRLLDIAQNPKDVVPIKKVKQPQLSEKIASAFLPQNVVEYSQTGEFRNVIPIFISFQAASKETFNEFVSILMESANKFGGYFNKLDSGDKGNVAIIVFGAPKAFEDNTRRALNFILSVKQDLKNLTDIKL
jgi:class 3 adenylate cyclase